MLDLALSQICTRIFHLVKSIPLESVWVGDSRPFIFFSFLRVFTRLQMRHTRDLGVGIQNYAYWTF